MYAEKEIVNFWLNKNGFFTINDVKAGQNKTIDLIAIKLVGGKVDEVKHVEVSCSLSSSFGFPIEKDNMAASVASLLNRKFDDRLIRKRIQEIIREYGAAKEDYERVVVFGALAKARSKEIVKSLEEKKITVLRFEDILFDVIKRIDRQDYNSIMRAVQLTKYLLLTDPRMLSKLISNGNLLNIATKDMFLRYLLHDKGILKHMEKETHEENLGEILRDSSLKKPKKLAKLMNEILTPRQKNEFIELLSAGKKKPKKSEEKDLSYYIG